MKRLWMVVLVLVCASLVVSCGQRRPKASGTTSGMQKVHFDLDRSNIKSEYEPALKQNAAWMQANSGTNVTVEGHCDERGSTEYNIALGDRRAGAAKKYVTNLGVAGSRLNTLSYGEEKPTCNGHDESCWWQNRRAEFIAK